MKTKHILLAAAVVLLSGGCTKELPIAYDPEPHLILVAGLRSGTEDNSVYLSLGTKDGYRMPSKDAKLRYYVNGEPGGELSPEDQENDCFLVFRLPVMFSPGDRVKIEAEANDMTAYAENVFPAACEIAADSSSVSAGPFPDLSPDPRIYSFSLTVKDIPGERTYFMAPVHTVWSGTSPFFIMGIVDDRSLDITWYDDNDPVFENIASPISPDMEAETGLTFSVRNLSRIFSDSLFEDGEYVFRFDNVLDQRKLPLYFGGRPGDVAEGRSYVKFSMMTLNEADYRYFRFYNSWGSTTELSEPVIIVSNVVGGEGYVAAVAMTEERVDLKSVYRYF